MVGIVLTIVQTHCSCASYHHIVLLAPPYIRSPAHVQYHIYSQKCRHHRATFRWFLRCTTGCTSSRRWQYFLSCTVAELACLFTSKHCYHYCILQGKSICLLNVYLMFTSRDLPLILSALLVLSATMLVLLTTLSSFAYRLFSQRLQGVIISVLFPAQTVSLHIVFLVWYYSICAGWYAIGELRYRSTRSLPAPIALAHGLI